MEQKINISYNFIIIKDGMMINNRRILNILKYLWREGRKCLKILWKYKIQMSELYTSFFQVREEEFCNGYFKLLVASMKYNA